jgi:hypothetical protein
MDFDKSGKIADRTVKEIFSESLGPEKATEILGKIQEKFDLGMHGQELRNYAQMLISEEKSLKVDSNKLVVVAIAIALPV